MKAAISIVLAGALAGCVAIPPSPLVGDPSTPGPVSLTAGYRTVTAGYVSRRPLEPSDWRALNRRVAPGGEAR